MKLLLLLLLCLPFYLSAKIDSGGIKFIQGKNWDEIKALARKDNKYIFVDCYATWCGPCKAMDKEVYPDDSLGRFINENFISVKVQMDSTNKDDDSIKTWYADAHDLLKQGKVSSFPTFLLFTSEGTLVHKGVGYQDATQLISLAKNALDPGKQYFSLLHNYNMGLKDPAFMPYLAITASQLGDELVAETVSKDYITNYLTKLNAKQLFTLENIRFLISFTTNTNEKGFSILFNNVEEINRTMKNPDLAQSYIHYFIAKDFIDPVLQKARESQQRNIEWVKLSSFIQKKYNKYYAERTIPEAKSRWYGEVKDWSNFAKYTVEFVEKYGETKSDFDLAQQSWAVFEHSSNEEELQKAMKWAKKVMDRNTDSSNVLPAVMDTYANLLYKIGYLFEKNKSNNTAIEVEERALVLARKYNNKGFITAFTSSIEKMKKGEATW